MLKITLVLTIVCSIALKTFASTYYFSSSAGNDGRTTKQAQNPSTPWKTLDKLEQIMSSLKPGDKVMFKRGDVFSGALKIDVSGRSGNPVIFAAYGPATAKRPVINGRMIVSDWSAAGAGVWKTKVAGLGTTINNFTINDKPYAMGRFPNDDAPDKGYLHIEGFDSCLSITDNELPSTPDFIGGELVIKPKRWLIDRNLITKHEGNTIWYNSYTKYKPSVGFGYFIQNHLKTLDRFGEWYFDQSKKELHVFFGNKVPQHYNVQASSYDALLELNKNEFVEIKDISFTGSNGNAVLLNETKNISLLNCSISNTGLNGISGRGANNTCIENCYISDVNNSGIDLGDCSKTVLKDNTIKRCGMLDGTGPSGNSQTVGIRIYGDNNTIEYNRLDSIGYIGLIFTGNNVLIKNNYITNFTMTKDDGGGIYTVVGASSKEKRENRRIIGNIVMHGIGNGNGTSNTSFRSALGIYMDDLTPNVLIEDNTVAYCAELGFFLHDAQNIIMKNNLSVGNDIQFAMHQDTEEEPGYMRNNKINNNVFVSLSPDEIFTSYRSYQDDIREFGDVNFNKHFGVLNGDTAFTKTAYPDAQGRQMYDRYSLEKWRTAFHKDQQSTLKVVPRIKEKMLFEVNPSKKSKKISLKGKTYRDANGKTFSGSVLIPPYGSVFLIEQ